MFPLLWLSAAFLVGLLLASQVSLAWPVWAGIGAVCLLLSFFERRLLRRFPSLAVRLKAVPVPLALALAALFGGAARYQAAHPPRSPADIAWYNGRGEANLRGWVAAYPEANGARMRLRVEMEELTPLAEDDTPGETLPVRGLLLVDLPWSDTWRYGDEIELRAAPEAPPEGGEFSYREALARQGVYSMASVYTPAHKLGSGHGSPVIAALYALRGRAYAVTNRIFPQPEAALLSGILLGLDQDLPPGLSDAFKVTGTAHIIAISGFNISILAGLFFSLFGRVFTRWWALLAAVLAILAYTLLVGAEPAVVRAAIMGGLALLGGELGRRSAGLNILALSAAVMCLFDPNLPWSASFQLSFAATLGLVLYGDWMQAGFRKLAGRVLSAEWVERAAGPVGEYLLCTLAAQITTLPVMVYQFKQVSLTALLSNPLVLPPQPLVMILGGVAVIAGLVWLPLGQALAYLAWPFAAYTDRMVELLGRIPQGAIQLESVAPGWLALMYAALFAVTLAQRRGQLARLLKPGLALTATGIAAVLSWQIALALPDGRLHVTLASPQGSPVLLVQTPGGRALLVNAAMPPDLADLLGQRLPPTRRQLDGILLARSPGKTWAGLPALAQRYSTAWVAGADALWDAKSGEPIEKALLDAEVETQSLREGTAWDLGGGARLEVITVAEDGSAALLLEQGNFRALLPGGVKPGDLPASRLAGITLLILDERDVKNGLDGWQNYHPLAVWISAKEAGELTIPPGLPAPLVITPGRWVQATTDGSQLWVESGAD